MTANVFRTGSFTKQLRLYLQNNRKRSVPRAELFSVFGSDKKTKKRIYRAISSLADQGHLIRTDEGVQLSSQATIPGERADKCWNFWRMNPTFTATETTLYTGVKREYVKSLIRHYKSRGYIVQVSKNYSNIEERRYRLKDRNLLIRPSSE